MCDDDVWPARVETALTQARELAGDAAWEQRLHELAPKVLQGDAAAFLAWARDDMWWSLAVADAAGQVCAKPDEAAAFVLVTGLRDQLVEEGLVDDDD